MLTLVFARRPIDDRLLDPSRGLRHGTSDLSRQFPLLAGLGEYKLPQEDLLLDDKWQYRRMGLARTIQRRIPVIYRLARANQALPRAYEQAAADILSSPSREDLSPLDRDEEFLAWTGWAPDFHPRLHRFCDLDGPTAERRVQRLIDRIQGNVERDSNGNVTRRVWSVPRRMAVAFINLYRRMIRQLQARIDSVPPPPPGEIAGFQAEIGQLQGKIDALNQFLATLQDDGG